VTAIDDGLSIDGNDSLETINALNNITYLGGDLVIRNNDTLPGLTGIGNIELGPVNTLKIYNNSSLSVCELPNICDFINNHEPLVSIYNNANNCNSILEVASVCGILTTKELSREDLFSVFPNPSNRFYEFRFKIVNTGKGILKILNLQGGVVVTLVDEQMSVGEYSIRFDASGLPPGIYFYRFTADNQAANGKLILNK
jgi:hypothetical protein